MPTSADTSLATALAASTGLTALLGGASDPRIFAVEAEPETQLPYLVYQPITVTPATTHGEGGTDERLDQLRYQLTAIAATQLQADAVLYQARKALESSATLKGILIDERALPRSEEAQAHGRSADFLIWNSPDAS